MSEQELQGLVLDPSLQATATGETGGAQREPSRLRGLGMRALFRLAPMIFRSLFSGDREPAADFPVLEPGQTRPARLAELDFGDSFPTTDADLTTATGSAHEADAKLSAEQAQEPASVAETIADLAASMGMDLEAPGPASAPTAEANTAEVAQAEAAEAVAELGEAGL
jgi:hypothetical protein